MSWASTGTSTIGLKYYWSPWVVDRFYEGHWIVFKFFFPSTELDHVLSELKKYKTRRPELTFRIRNRFTDDIIMGDIL